VSSDSYAFGDTVAVFDGPSKRWRVAAVLAVYADRLMVATRDWWGVVPRLPSEVRPVRVVNA
jgi:hypothetical protein